MMMEDKALVHNLELHAFSSDEGGESGEDSEEDLVRDHLMGGQDEINGGETIHSPPTSTQAINGGCYLVLEDNLRQLQGIQETVQRMRSTPNHAFQLPMVGRTYARLSSSCPSLNEDGDCDLDLLPGMEATSPLIKSSTSLMDSDTAGSQELLFWGDRQDSERRRSWCVLGDPKGDKLAAERQRSVSLSSLGSNSGEAFVSCEAPALQLEGSNITSTTTSLTALTSGLPTSIHRKCSENLHLLPPRLPLQKSISTPSIIAVKESQESTTGPLSQIVSEEGKVNKEEIWEPQTLSDLWQDPAFPDDEDHGTSKRRKRGSLFFRKKKDKDKDKPKRSHQFVSVTTPAGITCEVCSGPLFNKSALRCESCHIFVHETSCKNHVFECTRSRIPKIMSRPSSMSGPSGKSSRLPSSASFKGTISPVPPSGNDALGPQRKYSQWRRVATKLGVNKLATDDKDPGSIGDEHTNTVNDDYTAQLEFPEGEGPASIKNLDTDPFLRLQAEEAECWAHTIDRKSIRKLKEKEVKRQEHIYEFVITEKHHCLTLILMQKVFADGLHQYFQQDKFVERLFPCLNELIDLHLRFLHLLRERQDLYHGSTVPSIADILVRQFTGTEAERFKAAYGEFCSKHKDSVANYKEFVKSDHRFEQFVQACSGNPLLRKKGIPECILFVTQRITKYPLLIDPLIKSAKEDPAEQEQLKKALAAVKEIIVAVDAKVADRERDDRKMEIYNRMDPKSFCLFRGKKFKKSDLMYRSLRFEGVALLIKKIVQVVVLSDVLFFLQETNAKYHFMPTDKDKSVAIPLQRLLVREKAGQGTTTLYLISNPSAPDPIMFEIEVQNPKERRVWIQAIRHAIGQCPSEEEELLDCEGRRLDATAAKRSHIAQLMRAKDLELASVLEDKIRLASDMTEIGRESGTPTPPGVSHYSHLVNDSSDAQFTPETILAVLQDANQWANFLHGGACNLSRSVSSVGERQSHTYVSPLLPRRAETFGGFDNASSDAQPNKVGIKKKNGSHSSPSTADNSEGEGHAANRAPHLSLPDVYDPHALLDSESQHKYITALSACNDGEREQLAALQLTHYIHFFILVINQQLTSIASLQSQLLESRSRLSAAEGREREGGRERRPMYNQALEELRNLQDEFSREKAVWLREKDVQEKEIVQQKEEIRQLQEQIVEEQADVKEQRETLYRKLEALQAQGIVLGPNLNVMASEPPGSISPSPPVSPPQRKTLTSGLSHSQSVNINLLSATNQQKAPTGIQQVRQKFPLKLAQLSSASGSTQPSIRSSSPAQPSKPLKGQLLGGPHQLLPMKLSESVAPSNKPRGSLTSTYSPPISHVRTGSSPALMQSPLSPHNQSPTQKTFPKPNTPDTQNKDTQQIIFF